MKINQVEELVDITKKNIRFYEEQGLVEPARDPQNGYREYSLEDVKNLKQVKLLRQLGVSIEDIRKLRKGEISLEKCMHNRLAELEKSSHDIEHMKAVCELLSEEGDDISSVDVNAYLDKMKELEKGGVRFMNVKLSDVRKRKNGAIIAAVVMVLLMIFVIGLILWADSIDPAPKGVLILMVAIFGSIIVGVLIALGQRIKELNGGELDEASKY